MLLGGFVEAARFVGGQLVGPYPEAKSAITLISSWVSVWPFY
jgi:hypothetical protein